MISPSQPTSSSILHVDYTYNDIDADIEEETIVYWQKKEVGVFVDAYTGFELPPTSILKSEEWRARVKPHDGEDYGNSVFSMNTITILNTPPKIEEESLIIVPEEPNEKITSCDNFTVSYAYFDIDNDPEQVGNYKWYVNRGTGRGFIYSGIDNKTVHAFETQKGEKWKCEFRPYDGTDYGEINTSDIVKIENTPPTISGEIELSPKTPISSDTLSVTYEYYDFDGDHEEATSFSWYVDTGDGNFVYYGIRDKQVYSKDLKKGYMWYCEIKPHDGEEFGSPIQSNIVTIGNSPPSVSDLQIQPEKPVKGEPLEADFEFEDIDADPDQSIIQWYLDGDVISKYNNNLIIPENVTNRGEIWYFIAKPYDGKSYTSPQKSPNVTIGNTPPVVINANISPSYPTNSDNLEVMYDYYDFDGDNITKIEIQWYDNEIHYPGLDDMHFVDAKMTYKQDVWYFKIRVYDGTDFSPWVTSPPKLIKNMRPDLTVTPKDSNIIINETEQVEFIAKAIDKDGDTLDYSWYLNGAIQSEDSSYVLTTTYDAKSLYNVTIKVTDGTAEIRFKWNVTVNNMNRKPTIEVKTPEGKKEISITAKQNQEFIITPDDPDFEDKENLTIKWYLDGSLVLSGNKNYVYQPASYSIGDHEIKALVSDGELNTTSTWNVTVKESADKGETFIGFSYDWWGLFLAVVSGIIAFSLFLFGFITMRKKKGKLKEYMHKIEQIKDKEKTPKDKEIELLALKKQIKKEFSSGLISENHYIILERELDDALGEARKTIVEHKVIMPEKLKEDVDEILEDGVVTKEEYKIAAKKIMASEELTDEEKTKLNKLMMHWMKEGKTKGLRK